MAVKGGTDIYNDLNSGEGWTGKTTASAVGVAGGVGGAAAIMALGASNPVGWVALAVGGAALLGRHLYELASETGDISDELSKQSNEVIKSYQQQNNQQIDNLYELREQLKETDSVEARKQLLINAGISTEQELQSEQYRSKDALIALTDQYIASTKKLNNTGEALLSDLENKQNVQQNEISTGVYSLLNQDYKNMSDEDKAAAADFGKKYYNYISELAESGDKDAKWRLEQWDKMGVNLLDDTFSSDDLTAIMKKGSNDTNNRLIKQFFTDSERVRELTLSSSIQESLGLDSAFNRVDYTAAINYLNEALLQNDKDTALNKLNSAKELGLTYDLLNDDYKNQLKDKFDISSYRTGLDYVPYDNYLANLHEGEAVLTADTANELRNLVVEYRETNTQSINFEAIIQTQTADLVSKLDEVIVAISNNGVLSSNTPSTSKTSRLDNMLSFRSSKSFM